LRKAPLPFIDQFLAISGSRAGAPHGQEVEEEGL
jgi:hypothetical protein